MLPRSGRGWRRPCPDPPVRSGLVAGALAGARRCEVSPYTPSGPSPHCPSPTRGTPPPFRAGPGTDGIEAGEELRLLHQAVEVDVQPVDDPGDLGTDVHRDDGRHIARRVHHFADRPARDRLRAVSRHLPPAAAGEKHRDERELTQGDSPYEPTDNNSPPRRASTTASAAVRTHGRTTQQKRPTRPSSARPNWAVTSSPRLSPG